MEIIEYNTEIDSDMKTVLVKENSNDYPENDFLTSPQKIVNMFNQVFRAKYQSEEYAWLLALNTKCKPIGVFEVSHGSVNLSLLNPREVFVKLLLCGAVHFVVVHNHPSGVVTPSKEDAKVTSELNSVGKLIGISLIDHIIIGGECYWSFTEKKMI